jgi:uncharacterized protein (TIGR02147 family)
MGFQNRSFLRLLLTGKRNFTQASVELLIKGLKLNSSEARSFAALVEYSQARTILERENALSKLSRKKTSHLAPIRDKYRFLSSHLIPRLFVLLSWPEIDQSDEALAKQLKVSVEKLRDDLETLQRMGLITRSEKADGSPLYEKSFQTFDIKDDMGDLALQSFHKKSLEEAIHALEANPSTRWYQALLLPLTQDEQTELKSRITHFLDEVLAKYQGETAVDRTVYQLNLSLIEAAKPILRDEPKARPVPSQPPATSSVRPTDGALHAGETL